MLQEQHTLNFGMRFFLPNLTAILFLILSIWEAKAQTTVGLHPELQWRYARKIYTTPGVHTMVQPWRIPSDSSASKKIRFFVHPLADMQVSAGSSFRQNYGAGLHAGIFIGKTLSVDFNYSLRGSQFFESDQLFIDSTGLVPHYDRYLSHSGDFYLYQSLNFNISWTPIPYVTIRAGKDRHFWGDGYRSLFLSDNANSYPYLQMILEFWHVKYIFMVSQMADYRLDERFEHRYRKYTSMHCLSWNITPSINVNLFETIIWNSADSVSKRTFDINYLNPVIFLRPVEYSIGSPDNVLIGFGAKARIWRENYLYGQFIFNEFKLNELVARDGWWANKYAFQLGLRSFWGTQRQLMLQAEFNQVRPFNYTHYGPLQNYGHLGEPLAHPMGANLREGLLIARCAVAPNWSVHATITYAVQGTDTVGISNNYGGNIYKGNSTRSRERGNTMLQGVQAITSNQELKLVRMLVPKWNLQAEAILSHRYYSRDNDTNNSFYLGVGIRTLLYRN